MGTLLKRTPATLHKHPNGTVTNVTPTRKTTPTSTTMMTKTTTTFLVAAMALALATSSARAQDIPDSCNDLDPSTPAAFATILPCTGWDQTCQSNVMAAGASCIQEIQAIQTWMNQSGTTDQIESATGLSPANSTSDPD